MQYGTPVNCRDRQDEPLHSPKVTVCLQEEHFEFCVHNSVRVTVAAECYVAMLQNILAPQMEALSVRPGKLYFPAS